MVLHRPYVAEDHMAPQRRAHVAKLAEALLRALERDFNLVVGKDGTLGPPPPPEKHGGGRDRGAEEKKDGGDERGGESAARAACRALWGSAVPVPASLRCLASAHLQALCASQRAREELKAAHLKGD